MSGPRPIDRLLAIMAQLRHPTQGCPWDRAQTFDTIAPYTIEEAYEVAEAIETGDHGALREELGDLLFQVVFHARLAEEAGLFTFEDVAAAIADKMERRHPHVFKGVPPTSAESLRADWETAKARERADKAAKAGRPASVLDGVGTALPALTRAAKIQDRAAQVGFDWPAIDGVLAKIDEELAELRDAIASGATTARVHEELGDILFSCVNLARCLAAEPEGTLREASRKFEARFRAMETALARSGKALKDASLAELEAEWSRVKQQEKPKIGS
ncbi:MAG: nucleoside triphosphate pyrophosphohydrolase [Alphaproteobacteria bacterium]